MKQLTIADLLAKKERGEKIVMVTAYDYPSALIAESAGVDIILVGDSLGNVVMGYDSTIHVTMADMLHHTKMVTRACKTALVVADLPFGSYHISNEEALRNAVSLIKDGGATAVKLEGGKEVAPLVAELTKKGIPVMAHIGLLPQTAALWQGYRVQGRDLASTHRLLEEAQELEQAGAFSVVLECVARESAALLTKKLQMPTIGIGAGAQCDGQVLVFHDLVGYNEGHMPRFVKQYGNVAAQIRSAISQYAEEVRQGDYPDESHSFPMDAEALQRLY